MALICPPLGLFRSGGNVHLSWILVSREGRLECVVVASLGAMEATADANGNALTLLTQRTLAAPAVRWPLGIQRPSKNTLELESELKLVGDWLRSSGASPIGSTREVPRPTTR